MNYLPLLAEFLGTFLLVLSIMATGNAFIVGGALALIILLIGGLSGAHVNPAVSLSMFLRGSLSVAEFVGYLIVQFAAGAAALYTYRAFA